jgi:large subunit ribosomal protein L2
MARQLNPVTPSTRARVAPSFDEITKYKPEKQLLISLKRTGGRNVYGRITMNHVGGGHKKNYRIIDFKRDKFNIPATVIGVEYDPNRTSRIVLLSYKDGEKRYILAPVGLKVGDVVMSGDEADIKPGNALKLKNIPVGTFIHNVELNPGEGGKMGRSAGAGIQLMAKEGNYAHLRMPSGEMRLVSIDCMATVGQVGNLDHENIQIGKAGRNRWRGIRPTVRGMAMNPCDHPHGGGEGRSKGGNHPVSGSNVPAKGFKTRKKKPSDWMIIKRRG